MTKTFILLLAVTVTAREASGEFPLTHNELWQLLFVVVAALFTSLSKEASKHRESEGFSPLHFFGDVGLGLMAGVAIPLVISWVVEHFTDSTADWRASVGLSIMGAYMGHDALRGLWNLLVGAGELAAKLKGLKISFDAMKGGSDVGTQETSGPAGGPPPETGFPAGSDVTPLPDDSRGGDGRA